jgi:rhamnogalacturonan hydrolase
MKMIFNSVLIFAAVVLPSFVSAQLASGYSIEPLTTSDAKWGVKVRDVTSYGAVADLSTDLGPPLAEAFAACKSGGIGIASLGSLQHVYF